MNIKKMPADSEAVKANKDIQKEFYSEQQTDLHVYMNNETSILGISATEDKQ
ncbi:hypothetical protein GJU40_01895 [Bacillus lacus]|uniref:Uncharacterized protein n=1 Tax=Metabacillus lacus TaxID=1983721 RepID=A0A7X2IWA9_9BACI|nr:hypothetical protein [Metabacillus lacus]MRX70920.1 hypothetical protein [Metabacillus lacus]